MAKLLSSKQKVLNPIFRYLTQRSASPYFPRSRLATFCPGCKWVCAFMSYNIAMHRKTQKGRYDQLSPTETAFIPCDSKGKASCSPPEHHETELNLMVFHTP
jgi:hypothetical protein